MPETGAWGSPVSLILARARSGASSPTRASLKFTPTLTFILLKSGVPVARLVPDTEKRCLGRELAAALAQSELSAAEAAAWHRELQTARKALKTPPDKWR